MTRVLFASACLLSVGCEEPDDAADSARPPVVPLAATTVRLLPDGQENLLVPIQVGLDPVRRRLYVSSNGLPTLAEVDLDTMALVTVHPIPEMRALHPLVAADESGIVWLGFAEGAPLGAFDPVAGLYTVVEAPFDQVHAPVAIEGEHDVLLALGRDRPPLQLDLAGLVLGLDAATGGGVNALFSDAHAAAPGAMVTLSGDTLVELARCALADGQEVESGFSWFDELPGRGFALTLGPSVAVLDCESGEWNSLRLPGENYSVFGLADGVFLALDRVGGADRHWGLARTFGRDLTQVRDAVQLGKNSGYGATPSPGWCG
ncbi:MAG: hypothetical protein EXR71_05315 [Myxococcales bacterium]|nr:hypothetical protein [Myxococcales bacterium]